MRFDDSLRTVLSADTTSGLGARSAWRQIVDLMGRRRIATDDAMLDRLRLMRAEVPVEVRSASARALAFAVPDPALVRFFAEDELPVAAPLLRTAAMLDADWLDLLPRLTPATRSVLRQRRDLPDVVKRALDSLGSVDFTLPCDASIAADASVLEGTSFVEDTSPLEDVSTVKQPLASGEVPVTAQAAVHDEMPAAESGEKVAPAVEVEPAPPPAPAPLPAAPFSPSSFVALGEVTRTLPVVAEALRRSEIPIQPVPARFEIADLVARIDAYHRDRDHFPVPSRDVEPASGSEFRFETDATGTIRWVDGAARTALVGLCLAHAEQQGLAQVDAAVAAAVRRRARFGDGRLEVGGVSDAAGSWRIGGVPAFDPATGRFIGFSGSARRPQRHEVAEVGSRSSASDSLRQLVHELRTPANAVAGFAELIEGQLFGPVPEVYRSRAGSIRSQAADLLAAIDDLDTAARLEGRALELHRDAVPLLPLLDRVAGDLWPLVQKRGAVLATAGAPATAEADDRATERLVARLLAALVSAAEPGEMIEARVEDEGTLAALVVTRPRALADLPGDALFHLDDTADAQEGAPLLGAGFTLRLVRNLASELGGALTIGTDRLTLRLPAFLNMGMEQASTK